MLKSCLMSKYLSSHPRHLWILCFAELCDRLVYYGALSILVIYLTTHYSLTDARAYAIFGIYTTLGFGTPVIGGFIADRFLGLPRSIVIGGLMISAGCFSLELQQVFSFYFGLSVIICGIGLFKSTVTSQLGLLYDKDNPNKGAGYTLFYMSMNVGAIIGPIAFGYLAIGNSYHMGFLVAGIAMFISTMLFLFRYQYFSQFSNRKTGNKIIAPLLAGLVILCLAVTELFHYAQYFGDILLPFGAIVLCLIVFLAYSKKDKQVRLNILQLVLLTGLSIAYFACAKQSESSLLLFINRDINHSVFGLNIPPVVFASIKPMFIVAFAMLFAPLWQWYCKKHKAPPVFIMVAIGLFLGAFSFAIFALSATASVMNGVNLPIFGVVLGLFILGIGELCIIPAVTTAVSSLAPKEYQSTFMGIWFLSTAFSGYVASIIPKLTNSEAVSKTTSFTHIFWDIAGITATIATFACLLYLVLAIISRKNILKISGY